MAAAVLPHALYVVAIGGDHFEFRPFDLCFPFAFLLLADGAVTGSVFPASVGGLLSGRIPDCAEDSIPIESSRAAALAAGAIASADHTVAALAALTAAILFVPVFGLTGTAWLACALQALSLALAAFVAITRTRP